MKLIDKDSLLEIINANKPLTDGYHMKDYVFEQILHDIDNEPIVEAIPIAWLEGQRKCVMNTIGAAIYSQIIEDWRKEND